MFGPGSNTGVSSSPQGPIFHDGMKEWSCCKKRSHNFSLFLKIPGGENGELRLGIRRAVRPRNGLPESVVGNQNCYPNFLSSVANAISTKSMFHVSTVQASQPDFIVPYKKYVKSIKNEVIIGTRFKMRFEMDESPERRCNNGMVIGMSDLDPYRWPKSKWRCLMVRWDENKETNHQDHVSPWEIDPSASLPQFSIQSSPRPKKLRMGQQATSPSHLFTGMHPNAEIKHTSSFLTTC
ncbi:hypothetical protein RIF29_39238 [Crotalaria pallida]|uniref:CHORD domain-containing protein n=1 Tax=Crotalaria pallida TaxID=3830 RepID=A0AAN9E737_CROPI